MNYKKRLSEDWRPLIPCNCRLCRKRNDHGTEIREKIRNRVVKREIGLETMDQEKSDEG